MPQILIYLHAICSQSKPPRTISRLTWHMKRKPFILGYFSQNPHYMIKFVDEFTRFTVDSARLCWVKSSKMSVHDTECVILFSIIQLKHHQNNTVWWCLNSIQLTQNMGFDHFNKNHLLWPKLYFLKDFLFLVQIHATFPFQKENKSCSKFLQKYGLIWWTGGVRIIIILFRIQTSFSSFLINIT